MNVDLEMDLLPARDRYRLLTSVVTPRPIALVTTQDAQGRVNAAPFSFFNLIGTDPPLVVLGIGDRAPGIPKDTAANIRATGEFVVNLVIEEIAQAMNVCGADFPAGVDEMQRAGLTCAASRRIRPPRVAESPVNLECREHSTLAIGRNRIIIGQVLLMSIRSELLDETKQNVRIDRLAPIGRAAGLSGYTRTTDRFELPRVIPNGA